MKASELFSRIRRDLIEVSGYIAQIEEARRTRARDPPGRLHISGITITLPALTYSAVT